MSQLKPITYIDNLLESKWKAWQASAGPVVNGYPCFDVSKIMQQGGKGTGINIDRNPEAEYLDTLILKLSNKQKWALIARYLWPVSDEQAAEQLHTNRTTLQNRVYRAHFNLDSYIQQENPFNWR